MSKKRQLVLGHLEGVSWRILETYPGAIREMIRGQSGVYALYKGDNLYYVGLATNLMARLARHLKDRHRGSWNRFSVYLTVRDEHMKELESLLLRIATPPGNKQSGKFAKSENLLTALQRTMRDSDEGRRADMLGGKVAQKHRKKKISKADRLFPLNGAVDRSIRLWGERGGWEYTATLRRDGTIRYENQVFDTPSAAGRAAVKGRCNGWNFWWYRNGKGEWVRLGELKK